MEGAAVLDAVRAGGAAACGAVRREVLEPVMTKTQRAELERRVPGWRAVLAAAFPYYTKASGKSAISRYAWGRDYHRVLAERLSPAAELLREGGARAEVLVDASPVPERAAALFAGIGMLGDHGLVIVPPYGSYVFLGTVATDAEIFDAIAPRTGEIAACPHCGACRAACPSGALTPDGFDMERCLSHISQKKGALTAEEEGLLGENGILWGCDACQAACPMNRDPRATGIPDFASDLVTELTAAELAGLSGRAFRRTYGSRAFAWRGVDVLRRNLAILERAEIAPDR